ncbi:MAG: DUF6531 domain-containing protein, partial [Polyangiaceae bacterium]|nr:DUF6531 domain-containing protein [Polyangiaceae bacterium]
MRRFYPLWLCLLAVVLGSPQAQAQCDDKNPQCGGGQGQDNGGSGWTWEDVKKLPDRVVDGIENATNKAADWCEEAWNDVGDYLGLWGDDPPPPPPPSSQDYYNVGTQTGGAIGEKLWSETASAKVPHPAQQSSSAPALPAREQGRSKALAGPAQPDRGLADDPGSQRADADPVALRTGEFVHQTVDLEVLGGQIPFGLVRTYRSRRAYDGPLGESWDHSLNMRVHLQRNPACIEEITVSLGDLGPVRMRADAR